VNCKNCNTVLTIESDYCNSCGGKVIRNRLTFRNLIQHIGETFFNYDNKVLKTIIHLIKSPEKVIDGYVIGIRKRYINPISFFGISLTLTGFSIFVIKKFFKDSLDASKLFDTSEMYSNGVSQDIMTSSTDFSLEYSSLIYTLMIPSFALLSWIIFLNKKYNYTEHLVSYMYSMSLYSITSVFFGLVVLLINPNYYLFFGLTLYPIVLIYHCYLLKRVFNLSATELLLKTFLFIVLFSILAIIFFIIIAVIMMVMMYLNGDLETMIEAKKAAKGI
jgi:hypothetical protein